jgi:glutamine amidotransferase
MVEKLSAPILPHIGWTKVDSAEDRVLFRGLQGERFYFVHYYAAKKWELDINLPFPPAQLAYATDGERFLAELRMDHLVLSNFIQKSQGKQD